MTLSDRSMCMIPHQSIGLLLSSLFLIRLFSGAQGRGWKEAHMFRIYCKVKNRTQKRKQIIQSDQDVQVCEIFLDGTRIPFCITLSFILRYGLSFSFFLFLFLFSHASGHGYFSSAFLLHSPYYFCNMKSHVKAMEYFCVDERHIFAELPV